ncbi:hypothetical protein [Haliangium sp.]|uniref:hypothetical protein n=1 Tax=Haliangium sp. TaxID=2663208 RepID=UPI003D106597
MERFGDRYEAIDVFADDIQELRELPQGRTPKNVHIPNQEEGILYVDEGGTRYRLRVFKTGVARMDRGEGNGLGQVIAGAAIGALIGAAIGAASNTKGDSWASGMVVGLLGGALAGGLWKDQKMRRVFALRFDPDTHEWHAYDGGLLPWMKEQFRELPTAG